MAEPLRVAIADDEPLARLGLRQLLHGQPDIAITGEACDGGEAVTLVRRTQPDLLLLDIQMPDLDGFGVLAALAAELGADRLPVTIFVTAHDDFAVRAFEAHALDYVTKPVREERFAAALARARAELERGRAAELGRRLAAIVSAAPPLERIVARLGDRSTVISVDEIDWIEAQDYTAALHVGHRVHVVRRSLAALEGELDARRFVRIHRSALVNVARIRELRHVDPDHITVVLTSGTELPVSRRRRHALERVLGRIA